MKYSPERLTDEVQRLSLLVGELRAQNQEITRNIRNLGTATAELQAQPDNPGQIDNIIRNSKLRHSWDTWANLTPVVGNQQAETAHVYTHGPDTSVQVFTGEMEAASTTLEIDTGGPADFDTGDVGKEIVVEGAGADGSDLVTTIASFVSSTEVTLADAAVTGVSATRVRWRLQTLALTSTKTGTASVNAALKSPDHADFASNITDPFWNKSSGWAELGSTNTIDFPLGSWNNTASAWVFKNEIQAAKTYYIIFRIARKNVTIKPKGFMGCVLWDNSPGKRQPIEGGRFTLTARVEGVPAATVSSQYKIIARTDRSETLESNVFTIDRPDDVSFVTGSIYTVLSWNSLPGVRTYEVWRETAGTFVKLSTISNGQNIFLDQGAYETNETAFPVGDLQRKRAERFTPEGGLDELPVTGASNWEFMRFSIVVPASYDTSSTTQQWLRIVLTEAPDREVTDAVTSSGSDEITSAQANFTADDVGREVEVTSGSDTFIGTITAVTDESTIEVDSNVPFSAATATLTIVGGGSGGLLVGEFGLALTLGAWAANHDDTTTARGPASNPSESPIGGTTPGGDPPGGGGTYCVREDMRVRMPFLGVGEIVELPIKTIQVGNLTASGNLRPNTVLQKDRARVHEILQIDAGGRTLFCTSAEPLFRNFEDLGFDKPTPAGKFKVGDTIAQNIDGYDELNEIEKIEEHRSEEGFWVETFVNLHPGHVSIIEGFYRHNAKEIPGPPLI